LSSAGSGSTGVACARIGRSFVGVELSEEFAAIARARIAAAEEAAQVEEPTEEPEDAQTELPLAQSAN